MNVIVVSCVFPPEPMVSANTSYDIALYLHTNGYNVKVLCPFPNRNVPRKARINAEHQFSIHNVRTYTTIKGDMASRFLENISFGVGVAFSILFSRKINVVYSNTWPIFSSLLIGMACKLKGIALIHSIQDLYPETLVYQKKISDNGILYRFLMFLEKTSCAFAKKVIVISDGFREKVVQNRGLLPEKVELLRNWQDSSSWAVLSKESAKKKLGLIINRKLESHKVYVYGGNIGLASGITELLESWISSGIDGYLLIAGDGSLVSEIRDTVSRSRVKNVFIISPWPIEHTSLVYSSADALLLPIAESQEFASVPSKLMSYMLSNRPIIMFSQSESASSADLRAAGGGIILNSFCKIELKKAHEYICSKTELELDDMGLLNRKFAEANYCKDYALSRFFKIFKGVADS
ncbi:glycosyltransferase family 4 protein [Pseudoalteromonas xiamenensis]|uniref:glycosyltransferase family 4 protein n=1 Tax=Pseudoalteromonas xiamenensis TaxID=882626 RepID=UPI0035EBB973